ncbi:efflux transporter outer membrane subunit [Caenimonas sedimenti]|uniref:Efflux transporter outer membrane subunit n=1 Tax=Caenimonas sedimenti TaxID=2596921 RepID=A0A562ZFN8_9BURK|nr:efflux transporter outer membrane subunit [Caenimonas sedimenti]TWO66617.1 efflux transporter outer membrane subunit [Caenimonas sedimenti]
MTTRSRLFALSAAAAATLWLAGCAAVARPPESVAATAPPQWYAPLPHGGTLTDLKQWWQQFNDPLLIDLIEAAQTVSPTVASAGSRIAQARASRVAAGAALLPTLDATAAATRGNAQAGAPLATTLQGGLQTAWEIDLFGGNRAAADAAQARLDSERAGWHAARVAVAAETANSYLNLRTCERQLGVVTNDARSRAETARLTALSAEAGFTAPAVSALARASAAEASARVTQQRAQCEIEIKGLVALSGLPEPQLRQKLDVAWAEPTEFALVALAPLPAQLLVQRPDVYQSEREVAAASADVGTARADRLPRLTLSGQVGRLALRAGGSTNSMETWSIGPLAMTMPIFDGGRRAANEDAATARYEEAVALYTARVRQAVREVEEALVVLESARDRSQDARTAVEGYRASFSASEARYRSGLGSLIEMEDQRRVALAAELALVNLQRERIAAWIALYRAVGGGWARPEAIAAAPR